MEGHALRPEGFYRIRLEGQPGVAYCKHNHHTGIGLTRLGRPYTCSPGSATSPTRLGHHIAPQDWGESLRQKC
jgi:hypothetical protein